MEMIGTSVSPVRKEMINMSWFPGREADIPEDLGIPVETLLRPAAIVGLL